MLRAKEKLWKSRWKGSQNVSMKQDHFTFIFKLTRADITRFYLEVSCSVSTRTLFLLFGVLIGSHPKSKLLSSNWSQWIYIYTHRINILFSFLVWYKDTILEHLLRIKLVWGKQRKKKFPHYAKSKETRYMITRLGFVKCH